MNCFHFIVSSWYNTTQCDLCFFFCELWIAFILSYLRDTTQLSDSIYTDLPGCELLSFYRIFVIQHNKLKASLVFCFVVNCFHFIVSSWYNTTKQRFITILSPLWIAFILSYLRDTTQRLRSTWRRIRSCELLSFYRIFVIQHNCMRIISTVSDVVNCFHFIVSSWYNTTTMTTKMTSHSLWIAFILSYLRDTTQLNLLRSNAMMCCELLSFYRIFVIQHN